MRTAAATLDDVQVPIDPTRSHVCRRDHDATTLGWKRWFKNAQNHQGITVERTLGPGGDSSASRQLRVCTPGQSGCSSGTVSGWAWPRSSKVLACLQAAGLFYVQVIHAARTRQASLSPSHVHLKLRHRPRHEQRSQALPRLRVGRRLPRHRPRGSESWCKYVTHWQSSTSLITVTVTVSQTMTV